MARRHRGALPDLDSDPFRERSGALEHRRMMLLGAQIRFESNSRELLQLADRAFRGLPRHRLSTPAPDLRIELVQTSAGQARKSARARRAPIRAQAPPIVLLHGAGLLGGATDSSSFVVLSARERAALVAVSSEMLKFPYHARYELIEFAVYTLAARVQRLVPLHAACIGRGGRGILLIGPSGAGKSTVALHGLLRGFDFLSEDSVFVAPHTMRATGAANFLHVRADSLRWIGRGAKTAMIRRSPVIRRRSGVEKFEVDLREAGFRLAKSPLKIAAVAFLSPQPAGARPLLRSLSKSELRANLAATQAYAASQPQWQVFDRNVSGLEAFELRRGRHPLEAVEILGELLAGR